MNRTIKFRAKRKGAPHEWLIGDLAHIEDKVYIFDRGDNAPLNSPDWYEVIPETVGQLIGLNDNNGNKVYEGDILQGYEAGKQKGLDVVIFERGSFKLMNTPEPIHAYFDPWEMKYCKVVGNIHDNPELLK